MFPAASKMYQLRLLACQKIFRSPYMGISVSRRVYGCGEAYFIPLERVPLLHIVNIDI